jgi:tetratricopeptide (TPR) repeat protein
MDEEAREQDSIHLLLRALEHDKNNLEIRMALKALQDKYIKRLLNESQSLLARQQHQPAIERLEAVRAIRPDEPGIEDRLNYCSAALAFNTGMLQYNMKRYAQAAFQFKKTLMHQKEHAEAMRYLRMAETALRQAHSLATAPIASTNTIAKKAIPDNYDDDPDKTLPPTPASRVTGHGPVGSLRHTSSR